MKEGLLEICCCVQLDFGDGDDRSMYVLDDTKLFLWLDSKTQKVQNSFTQHMAHRLGDKAFQSAEGPIPSERMHSLEIISESMPVELMEAYLKTRH